MATHSPLGLTAPVTAVSHEVVHERAELARVLGDTLKRLLPGLAGAFLLQASYKHRIAAVVIEWRDESGEKIRHRAHLERDRTRGLTVVVPQSPPRGSVAQVQEPGSAYPVEILSIRQVDGGFELQMDYLWEGRRREHRTPVHGSALLTPEGIGAVEVEVLNVSSGGMQLFASLPVKVGSTARIRGLETNRSCFVRYCMSSAGGYRLGIQFYDQNGKDGAS